MNLVQQHEINAFTVGFEKAAEANGLIGSMPNLASGKRVYDVVGKVRNPQPPKPGIVEAPRSDMPEIPTPKRTSNKHNFDPVLPRGKL